MSALRLVGVVGASAIAVAGLTQIGAGAQDQGGGTARGVVVDDTGAPVPGAEVRLGDVLTRTDAAGTFSLGATSAEIATVAADGHLGRAQVLDPAHPARVVLSRSGSGAVSLRFAGDAMMGRRFYEGRDGATPVLAPNASAADHAAVLADVQPLLEDSDLAVLNLETPLVEDPVVDRGGKRAPGFHPTKDLVIASSTAMAEGLAMAGIDVVSLGNNHAADALGAGIDSTVEALDAAGIVHFGAGRTVDQAWEPAVVERRGVRVAFLGCTTVTGAQHTVPYVATRRAPGAAECEPERLRREVASVRARVDVVVVMVHGHVEYQRAQDERVRRLARVAAQAGAGVFVAGHPHVVGGLTGVGDTVVAESMGNLVFDQELWDTLPTYLARVDVRAGAPVAMGIDPVLIDGYRPRPAVGALADAIARIAAGTVDGPARLDPAGAHLDLGGAAAPERRVVDLRPGAPAALGPGWWVPGQDGVRVGTDLLYGTGAFGDVAAGRDGGAERLWNVAAGDQEDGSVDQLWELGRYARVTSAAGCVAVGATGEPRGLELARSPLSTKDVIATMEHRAPVRAGERLSLLADVRRAAAGSVLAVHWYPAMSGGSAEVTSVEVPTGDHDAEGCAPVRLDVTVPEGMVAAQVFARVRAPKGGQTLRYLGVDDIRLVSWQEPGTGGRRYDTVESLAGSTVQLARDDTALGASEPLG